MWVALLYFITYAMLPGTNGTPNCEMRPTEYCPQMMPKFHIPESERDLNEVCPGLIDRIECLHNHDVACPSTNRVPIFGDEYPEVRSLLTDICDTNSLLHEILSENMQCIKTKVDEVASNCLDGREKLRKAYLTEREPQNLHLLDTDFDAMQGLQEESLFRCLDNYYTSSCLIGTIGDSCGAMAKSAVIEVFHRSNIWKIVDFCEGEERDRALQTIDSLDVTSDVRNRMKEFIAITADWN